MQLTESDLENLNFSKCDKSVVNDFFKTINGDTIGRKVLKAINQRQQGHFNDAMLNITEANRDQVLAIREIQSILDEIKGGVKIQIIFDKYRQQFPFQIGLVNGEEVLSLLDKIKSQFGNDFPKMTDDLHQNEEKLNSLIEELNFFEERMKGKISEQELNEIKSNSSEIVERIISTKKLLINGLSNFLLKEFNNTNPNLIIKLIHNFYILITSNIETLDSKHMEV